MKLLIVEDHKRTALSLKSGLEEAGFDVERAADGRAGLKAALGGGFDLLIVDLGLPKLDGWELLREFRERGHKTPLLILSARDDVKDRVRGLDLGADDYLLKPFAFAELLSRIRALLRRHAPFSNAPLAYAGLELFPAEFSAFRDGQKLDLSPKEFALLALFLRHQGEPLARSYLAEKIWNLRFELETNIIDVAVSRLRDKVDQGKNPKLIHTLRGVGYVLDGAREAAR